MRDVRVGHLPAALKRTDLQNSEPQLLTNRCFHGIQTLDEAFRAGARAVQCVPLLLGVSCEAATSISSQYTTLTGRHVAKT